MRNVRLRASQNPARLSLQLGKWHIMKWWWNRHLQTTPVPSWDQHSIGFSGLELLHLSLCLCSDWVRVYSRFPTVPESPLHGVSERGVNLALHLSLPCTVKLCKDTSSQSVLFCYSSKAPPTQPTTAQHTHSAKKAPPPPWADSALPQHSLWSPQWNSRRLKDKYLEITE